MTTTTMSMPTTISPLRMARILPRLSQRETQYVTECVRTPAGRIQPDRMTEGNTKLDTAVLCFSLPPIKSCLNCDTCKDTCFALKAYRQYIATRNAWDINLDLAQNYIPTLQTLLTQQIEHKFASKKAQKHGLYVRIHVSGDFISQEYMDMWFAVARRFPDVGFYAYSKVLDHFDISQCPDNLNLIDSFIDGQLNYGDQDYVDHLVQEHGAFLCPATQDSFEDGDCMKTCTYCLTNSHPCFLQH